MLSLTLTTAVHRLLVAELQIKIRSKPQPSRCPVFDIDKLREEPTLEKLRRTFLGSGVSNGPADAGSLESFRDLLISEAHETLGTVNSQQQKTYHQKSLTSSIDAAVRG